MKHGVLRAGRWWVALTLPCALLGQGTFENLGFESARNIPVFDPQGHPWLMAAADALPGWTCYLGSAATATAAYADVALDSAAVGLMPSGSPYPPVGFIVGEYALSLQYGIVGISPPFTGGPAAVGQTGQLPLGAQSVRFRGTVPFTVTFAGNPVPLTVLAHRSGYAIYAGDLRAFAGQTGELRFTSSDHFSFLDAIQFTSQPVPEPGSLALACLAWLLGCTRMALRTRLHPRPG